MNKKYFLGSINIILVIISSFLLLIGYNTKYIISDLKIAIIVSIITILSILIIRSYFTKKQNIYNIIQFICFLSNIIMIYNIISINTNNNYIENIITNKYEYKIYNVYVLKNTKYDNIKELKEKNIGCLKENEKYISEYLNKIGDYNIKTYSNIKEMEKDIEDGIIQSIIIDKNNENNNITIIEKVKIKNIKNN
ncbi:MAG: hypothetical protein IJZ46_04985 [Bacilli bacterium]|nr:hypothetical protein [Bacilli bacterium]